MTGQIYNQAERFQHNISAIQLDKYISRPDSDLGLDVTNSQLYRTISLEYIKKVSSIKHKIENYNNKAKYKTKDGSYKKIK